MNSAIVLNLFATICLFGAGDASDNADIVAINSFKLTIETNINGLRLHAEKLSSDLLKDQNEFKTGSLTLFDGMADMYTAEITKIIKSSGKQGQDADNCLNSAKQTLRLNFEAASIDSCDTTSVSSLDVVTDTIEVAIRYGNSIVDKLNKIAENCSSTEIEQPEDCITSKLSESRTSVEELDYNAKRLMEINVTSLLPRDRLTCFLNVVTNFSNDVDLVKSDTSKCLEKIQSL